MYHHFTGKILLLISDKHSVGYFFENIHMIKGTVLSNMKSVSSHLDADGMSGDFRSFEAKLCCSVQRTEVNGSKMSKKNKTFF